MQDVPSCHGGFVGGVERRHVAGGVPSIGWLDRGVLEGAGEGVDGAILFFTVGKAGTDWLAYEQHVRDRVPAIRVNHCGEVGGDIAWAELLEEPDQAVAAWTAVQPEGDRVVSWVTSRFEEPEESMLVG